MAYTPNSPILTTDPQLLDTQALAAYVNRLGAYRSQIMHGIYWLGWFESLTLYGPRMTAPLWVSLVFTIWCAYRWVRVGRDDDREAL